jgi:hypothetical protein
MVYQEQQGVYGMKLTTKLLITKIIVAVGLVGVAAHVAYYAGYYIGYYTAYALTTLGLI